ncbi:LrgB family protein [Pseudomonas sp. LS-2]|jgi:putative effector of murein hydrolase|uniref:LrgB family protein n=1 Tax=Pseudomonas sp. LS-2 TaxID=2315859 RepID=UPI000E711B84|nr:LrgB family protein [Pseudomonas sp. LS-2]RJX83385.1 LrgB family protein [Pseudomonas sp. LS-2]
MPRHLIAFIFLVATVASFYLAQSIHRRYKKIWLVPAVSSSLFIIALVEVTATPYEVYFQDTQWLVWLLGPATVAFALPIYQQRKLIIKYWLALLMGSLAGIIASVCVTLVLGKLLSLDPLIAHSLLARSVSTPFALEATTHMGGSAQLTSLFVVITGLLGIIFGEVTLAFLPFRSKIAKGAPLGTAAHGFGLSVAKTMGAEEGAVASLTMIFSGVIMVLLAPVISVMVG